VKQFLNNNIMAIDVSKLVPTLQNLKEGLNTVEMTYYGIVDNTADNPVRIKLYIEPSVPLFFIDNGVRTKVLKNVKPFSHTVPTLQSWTIKIDVTETFPAPKACALRLEATDAHGYKSSTNSFVIYF
jgi:hypothetical protein